MTKIPLALAILTLGTMPACRPAPEPQPVRGAQMMLRLDDVGMNHAVNLAIKRVAETGIPFSVSVLFACPWYQEAVTILKQHPQISVGVHLALNSEWRDYRWGPVLGATAVPTLVDSNGYFVHANTTFRAMKYDLGEVERELTAQVERAMRSGLRIDYVDHHMGTAASTPELRAVVERIAAKYNLGISGYFGEGFYDLFAVPATQKTDSLTRKMRSLEASRPTVAVIHVAEDTPDMRALFDMNYAPMNTAAGEPLTWTHRKAELEMLTSPEFARALRETGTRLITYNDVIRTNGLRSMKRPSTIE
jgi:chitin disaccharide deacetylase